MAAKDPDADVRDLYRSDSPHRINVVAVRGVTTGDTLDVSARFSKLQTAIASSVTSTSNGLPTLSGTTLTFAQAGLNNDTVIVLLVGGWL